MRVPLRLAALALLSGVTLGGCAYGLGDPYGGYGGVNVGYGSGYYGSGYGSPYGYGGYGYGSAYGYDPFGWYGNYYYPGSGIYVYDRDRHRRVMTDAERRFWREAFSRMRTRTAGTTTATASNVAPRENWSGFNRRSRNSASTETTSNSNRTRWQNRSSATTSSGDTTTTTTRTNNGWRGRGRDRSNNQ